MLLNRTKIPERPAQPPPEATDLRGRVMICTTMYRETWDEMSQYLKSIKKVAASQKLGEEYSWAGKFEAHVYFDNGARGSKLTDFSAQLVCLVQSIHKDCTLEKLETEKTWYGWKLHWDLPGSLQLPLNIHLKDNQEVKSKKRWSQVMYMESAVDHIAYEDDTSVKYILATDGDVDFDADSIVAMLLQMLSDREEDVGAVCARTHPVGSGPFVWYQMFDYAIGHWLQKVANHVLGSVLCAPGCFSVYRVEAIADVLEEYRSDVEEASDFLTKDMGEDRWFSTLLVKSGWKISYCAGAFDSTHCPEEFDEFWKQRRRWIPSTLANQILLLKNWKDIKRNNKYISMIFLLFQVILLLSTVISPSTCILIITGGLYYGVGVPTWLSFVFFVLVTLVFAVICIYYSQDIQLKVARVLCYIFLLAMAIAVVGTASQVVLASTSSEPSIGNVDGNYEGCYPEHTSEGDRLLPYAPRVIKDLTNAKCRDHCHHKGFDFSGTGFPAMCFCGSADDMENTTKLPDNMCDFPCPGDSGDFCGGEKDKMSVYNMHALFGVKLPADITTLYIAVVAGIHIIAALLHHKEAPCVIYGVVYLFTLPCVYILMNVYSICNLTDQSWGTREARSQKEQDTNNAFDDIMTNFRQCWTFCRRCCKEPEENRDQGSVRDTTKDEVDHDKFKVDVDTTRLVLEAESGAIMEIRGQTDPGKSRFKSTRQWLQSIFGAISDKVEKYEPMFTWEGYTDTSFIAGMTDKDLKDIGVTNHEDRHDLQRHIKKLHQDEPDIDITVPDNVDIWLKVIGLDTEEYKENFTRAFPEDMKAQDVFKELKEMTEDGIVGRLGVAAKGHLRRLKLAITRIRQPTLREERILTAKRDIEGKFQKGQQGADLTTHPHRLEHDPQAKKPYLDPTKDGDRIDQNTQPDTTRNPDRKKPDYLDPMTEQFRLDQNKEEEFKQNLLQLRNYYLLMFLVANSLWLVLMVTLVQHAELQVLNTNPLGLVFLVTFILVLGIQFAALVCHRLETFIEWVSRIPGPRVSCFPSGHNRNVQYHALP